MPNDDMCDDSMNRLDEMKGPITGKRKNGKNVNMTVLGVVDCSL